jgi:hypothetical protein
MDIITDSSNFIYLLGKFMDDGTSLDLRQLIMKFDYSGNLIWSKSWSDALQQSTPFSISNLQFHNGLIYAFGNCSGHPSIMAFDTAFNNLCYAPDTTFAINMNNYGGSSISATQYPAVAYSINVIPVTPALLLPDQLSTPFCSISGLQKDENAIESISYPNPFSNEVTIILSDFQKGALLVALKDILGKTILEKSIFVNHTKTPITLSTSNIPSGFYILQIRSGDLMIQSKVLKQ